MSYPKKISAILLFPILAVFSLLAVAEPSPEQLLAEGRVDDLVGSMQRRISISPNDSQPYNFLCRAYVTVGKWDAGIAACQKAVALDPGNSQYHLWLGRVYGEKADHSNFMSAAKLASKVRSEFEAAVRLDPRNQEARADLAEFYVEAPGIVGGGKDKAEVQAQELGALDPPQGHMVRARIAEKKNDPATAETEYRAAIRVGEGRPGTWLSLAQFYRRAGRLDEMQDAIAHAAAGPSNQFVLVPAAEALVRSKREIPLALELLRRYLANGTVEDAPAFKAHYLLGTLLEQQGKKEAAIEEYRRALVLAKEFSPAQNALHRVDRTVAEERVSLNSETE